MRFALHNHCDGVAAIPKRQRAEVEEAISSCQVIPNRGASPKISSFLIDYLTQNGWSNEVTVGRGSKISITSMKNHIGLCLQTGNMSRMYADLLKLQKMYLDTAIKAGIMIVPTAPAAKALGSNITNFDRLTRELDLFSRVIYLPLMILAFE